MRAPVSALKLSLLEARLAVCRLEPGAGTPAWAFDSGLFSVTRTPDELSVVCPDDRVPQGVDREAEWRAFKVEGPLEFSMVGVLSSVATPLAEAGVSIFAISTFDTDYVLVEEEQLEGAAAALRGRGHDVMGERGVAVCPSEDKGFLWEMLYEAAHWGPDEEGPKPPPEKLLSDARLRRYVAGWGRPGDFAVVATDTKSGRKIGAAWFRLFPADEPGYGFVDSRTPELAIAVSGGYRGGGIGGALLSALTAAAKTRGFDALSLSVQKSDPGAERLYKKNGFVEVRDGGGDRILRLDLR